MKKGFLALGLAAMMTLGMSAMAFAENEPAEPTTTTTYTDAKTVTITKTYELKGEGSSPAETFTIKQDGDGKVTDGDATSAPALGTITAVEYAKGAAGDEAKKTGTFTITLPPYEKTGVYEYTLKEVAGTTAGVTYRTDDLNLVVTVIEQGGLVRVAGVHAEKGDKTKTSTFSDNTYTANNLSVTKKVTGNLGDKTKEFKFTVTFAAPEGKEWKNEITIAGGSGAADLAWTENVATFTLSDSDTVTFENVPEGVTYTVDEDDYSKAGYTTTGEVTEATAMTAEAAEVEVTNEKKGNVDTGVLLDSMPYIMILAVVVIAGAAFIISRKRRVEF